MELKYEKIDEAGIFRVFGRLDASNVSTLKKEFSSHLEQSQNYILDLGGLTSIDSTGLGGIVACLKYVTETGGHMKIASLKDKPRMIFEITRAYRIFDIYDDLDSAIQSCKEKLHVSNV